MKRELLDQANKILEKIQNNENAIEILEKYEDLGIELSRETCSGIGNPGYRFTERVKFEGWEITAILKMKRRRLEELKEELKKL